MLYRWRFAWAWTIGAVLVLPACFHRPPKPPEPPPTCPVTCPTGQACTDPAVGCVEAPPSTATPPKGIPQGPERLLRIKDGATGLTTVGGQDFRPFGAEPCCDAWTKVPNQRWPLASEGFMDETGKYGANLFHFRIGPWWGDAENESEWADIGGAYLAGTLEWNTVFWQRVRDLAWHAYQRGAYVEVVPVDDWWLKGACGREGACEKKSPWPQADVDAWGKYRSPEAERLLRETVQELGCFGNVIWATGNEEDLIPGMTAEHVAWRISIIRDEQQKSGCGFDHLIGTGSWKDGIPADYTISHDRAAVTGPCKGRWCANNEHNPEHSPEQEAAYFKQALDAGQRWDAWRAGASDADWEKRLELFQAILAGQAGPVACYPPPDDQDLWVIAHEGGPGTRTDEVKAAEAELGSMCKEPKLHQNGIDAIRALNEKLRAQGYCAGHVGAEDHVMFLEENQSGGGTLWGEYHAVAPFDTGCWSTSNAHYPSRIWRYNGQWAPPTAPPPVECPNVPCTVSEILCKLHQAGQGLWDCTPKCPGGAPVLPEGDPSRAACEKAAMGGAYPTYRLEQANGITLEEVENPMQFRIRGVGSGVVKCVIPASNGANICKGGNTSIEEGVKVTR